MAFGWMSTRRENSFLDRYDCLISICHKPAPLVCDFAEKSYLCLFAGPILNSLINIIFFAILFLLCGALSPLHQYLGDLINNLRESVKTKWS
jgi:hypothetical protein